MDSRFTEKSRTSLRNANEIAHEMGYGYVGSEHIIAGILKEGSSPAAHAMENAGIKYDAYVEKISEYTTPDSDMTVLGTALPLTPRCRTILEMSFNEAKKTGSLLIAPEHLVLAVLREGHNVGAKIIADFSPDVNEIVRQMLGNPGTSKSEGNPEKSKAQSEVSKNLSQFGTDHAL